MQNAFLIGERIYLRAITEEDLPNYFSWLDDQETTRWMQRGIYPNTMDDMRAYLASMQQGGNMFLAIIKKPEHVDRLVKPSLKEKHIGNISLSNLHPTFRTAEISIIIGVKKSRGNGYGTEAINLIVNHAFTRMNLNRLQAGTVVKNVGSIRAFEKAGFQKEGILKQVYYCEGEYQDIVIMGLIKSDWRKEK
jgi:RimJ/RimL family protein N-acetyltransferase